MASAMIGRLAGDAAARGCWKHGSIDLRVSMRQRELQPNGAGPSPSARIKASCRAATAGLARWRSCKCLIWQLYFAIFALTQRE